MNISKLDSSVAANEFVVNYKKQNPPNGRVFVEVTLRY